MPNRTRAVIDPRPRFLSELLLLPALLLGFAACAGSDEPLPPVEGADGRVERLALRPVNQAEIKHTTTVVASLNPGDGIEDWKVEADEFEVGRMVRGDKRPTLWVQATKRATVTIPLPEDLPPFNQIAIGLYGKGDKKDLHLNLRGKGCNVQTEAKRFPGQSVQIVVHEIGELRQQSGPPQELKLTLTGRVQQTGIISIELMNKPIADWLPDPTEGTGMVNIGYEGRRAAGLTSERPLECRFKPRAGERLDFIYGQPSALRRKGERPRLRLKLSTHDEGPKIEAVLERYSIESKIDEPASWHSASIDLAAFAGREVAARFDMQVEGEGESVMALGQPMLTGPSENAPSVLLITSDTHRADYLGAADSDTGVRTPFLDQLVAEGTYFTDCYSTTNITNPSHIALMTATSPRDTGIINNISRLADVAPTLAEAFRDAGYLTLAVTSARHLSDDLSGLGQGFDRLSSTENQRDSIETIGLMEDWLEESKYRPVFAWLHIFDAHVPYFPPEEYRRLYYSEDKDPFDPDGGPLPYGATAKWLKGLTDIDYAIALYKSEVTYLDERLQEFVSGSRFQDGIIALTSDHGESLTSNNIYFEHKGLFPNTISVPMILWGQGVPAAQRVDVGVSQLDLGRTLLDLSSIKAADFPGTSLLSQVESEGGPRFAVSSHGHDASVQMGSWYMTLHLEHPPKARYDRPYKRHEVHLFDLQEDPDCKNDIAEMQPRRTNQLRQTLVDWLLEADTEGWNQGTSVVSTKDIEVLATLGYADEGSGERMSIWFEEDCACEFCVKYQED
ncbi:MAG: arylsulfatase A-like enzyme [Planctomycetota bacterium]|jgi:arylsulfatase A-like enzyme